MINTEIPCNYTASPSSLSGTPHLTINHEATVDLDSSNAFEGPEKLLEVWFAPSADAIPASARPNGLKAVSVAQWTGMLDLVHCKILSIVDSDNVDAYLLSESSMFVFPHKLVLKTCGTTTLLLGLPAILEIAALSAGFPHMPANVAMLKPAAASTYRVFYSRKNFLFPNQQRGPHRSWRDEVRALDRLFQRGSAYMIGKMNGEHWYLYLTNPDDSLTPPATPEHERVNMPETETKLLEVPQALASMGVTGMQADITQDETLEVLMTDLDEDNARQFYLDNACGAAEAQLSDRLGATCTTSMSVLERSSEQTTPGDDGDYDVFEQTSSDHGCGMSDDEPTTTTEGHALGSVVSDMCGLSDVYPRDKYPDARIDAYLFSPCGFSANGVIPAKMSSTKGNYNATTSTHYFTVHVTPEPQCSYASFETNVPAHQSGRETAEVVEQVLNIFRPGRFSVTLFEAKSSTSGEMVAAKKTGKMDAIRGYRRVEKIVHDLDGYDLVFRYFERHDWKGGQPRLGEAC